MLHFNCWGWSNLSLQTLILQVMGLKIQLASIKVHSLTQQPDARQDFHWIKSDEIKSLVPRLFNCELGLSMLW